MKITITSFSFGDFNILLVTKDLSFFSEFPGRNIFCFFFFDKLVEKIIDHIWERHILNNIIFNDFFFVIMNEENVKLIVGYYQQLCNNWLFTQQHVNDQPTQIGSN
jgi:hypothetical protein